MQLLILGGTAWLGRQVAVTALGQGHRVTCLARAVSGEPPAGATLVKVNRDRADAFDTVCGQRWDAVVDVSRHPGQVEAAARALRDNTRHFVFVSTGNVYADSRGVGLTEDAPLLPALQGDRMTGMEVYGEAKVACEERLVAAFGAERSMIVRAGLIGGPGDVFDRSGYWPWRFARAAAKGRPVLVPDEPDQPVQLIDVRDLAAWIVDGASRGVAGRFNAVGEVLPLAEHLRCAREVGGHDGPVVRAASEGLQQQGVAPWMGPRSLPLWLPMPEYAGFNTRDSRAAVAAGLRRRPLTETLRDTLAWERTRDPAHAWRSGLSDDDEDALLRQLESGAG